MTVSHVTKGAPTSAMASEQRVWKLSVGSSRATIMPVSSRTGFTDRSPSCALYLTPDRRYRRQTSPALKSSSSGSGYKSPPPPPPLPNPPSGDPTPPPYQLSPPPFAPAHPPHLKARWTSPPNVHLH